MPAKCLDASMKNDKTIAPVVKDDLCIGCGTCFSLCPLSAISIGKDNSRGIYVPQINWEMCNLCGICPEVCPGHSVDFDRLNMATFSDEPKDSLLGYYLNCYTGYATDYNIRYNAASGGLVTLLLIFALEEGLIDGVVVTRMSDENPLEPEPFIARTRGEVISASKSKYCPVPTNIVLQEILEGEGKYAVVGLPCHIHGIRKAEGMDRRLKAKIALHLGIFCGKRPSFLGTEFLLWQRGIIRENVDRIDYRGEGWPGGMSIYLKGGRRIFIPHFDAWQALDLAFTPRRCLLCCDGAAELADISFGDAWLPEFSGDKAGTSVVISRTPLAEELLQRTEAKGLIKLSTTTAARVAQSQQDFRSKKATIKLYMLYARLVRQKIPAYDTKLGKPGAIDIVNASLRLLGLYLSSRRRLWGLVPILYERIIPFLGKVRRFFKKLLAS